MSKIIKNILLISLLIIQMAAFAQNAVISGKVSDASSKQSMPGVHVVIDDTAGTTTAIDGTFELTVSPGLHRLHYRFIGYHDMDTLLQIGPNDMSFLDIPLKLKAEELGVVVVTAGRFEQKIEEVTISMEVLRPDLVESKNTTNMESIMDQIPGVTILDGQCNIRGGSGFSYGAGSRVLLLVDDLPLLSGDAGDVKWNFLPVETLHQVEVLKGASSALFGSSALNGVINFRTVYPGDRPVTNVNFFSGIYNNPLRKELIWWGNHNPVYAGTYFSHSQKIKNFDLVVGANGFTDYGYRTDENEQRVRLNISTRYRMKNVEGLSFGININTMYKEGSDFLLWQNADSGAFRNATPQQAVTKRTYVDPFITYVTKNGGSHRLRTRYFKTINLNNTNQESVADLYYGEYQFQKQWGESFILTQGIAGGYGKVHSDSLYGNHYSRNEALFIQADKKAGRFNISAGLRAEHFTIDDTATVDVPVIIRTGVSFRILKQTYMRMSFGQGYRFPSVAEKYISTEVGGLKIFPNPDLQPEKGWAAEVGLRHKLNIADFLSHIDVAGFLTEYKEMMEFTFDYYVPASITSPNLLDYIQYAGFKSQNIGNTRISGIDVSISGSGNIRKFNVVFIAGYTYTYPVDLRHDPNSDTSKYGNILKYRFFHSAKADVEIGYKKFKTGISMRYNSFMLNIDKKFEEKLFAEKLPSVELYILPGLKEYRQKNNNGDIVLDFRFSFQATEQSRVSLIINNLLNHEYMLRPGDIQPPRTVAVQYSLKF